jgi:hypothetical protein
MALKKIKQYKGMNCEYWRINQFSYDDINDTANISLWLYVNQEATSDLANNALIREVIGISGIKQVQIPSELEQSNPRDLLKFLLYTKIKESKKEIVIEEVDGNIVEVEKETNWFADAINC